MPAGSSLPPLKQCPSPVRRNRSPEGHARPKAMERRTALGRLVQAMEAEPCYCRDLPCRHMVRHRASLRLWAEILARWSPADHGKRRKGKLPPGGPPVLGSEDATRAARVALYETMAEAMQEMPWDEARLALAERRAAR